MSQPIAGYQVRFSTNCVTERKHTDTGDQVWHSNPTLVDVTRGTSIVHDQDDYATRRDEKRDGTLIDIPGKIATIDSRRKRSQVS